MLELTQTSVLEDLSLGSVASVTLRVHEGRTILLLQVSRSSLSQAGNALAAAGLPTLPGTTYGLDPIALWLAPNGWLVTSDKIEPAALSDSLHRALAGLTHSVVDVSHALVTLELQGDHLVTLLARGTGVDLAAATFRPGACLRTRLVHVATLLRPLAADRIEIVIDRASARQMRKWLIDVLASSSMTRTIQDSTPA